MNNHLEAAKFLLSGKSEAPPSVMLSAMQQIISHLDEWLSWPIPPQSPRSLRDMAMGADSLKADLSQTIAAAPSLAEELTKAGIPASSQPDPEADVPAVTDCSSVGREHRWAVARSPQYWIGLLNRAANPEFSHVVLSLGCLNCDVLQEFDVTRVRAAEGVMSTSPSPDSPESAEAMKARAEFSSQGTAAALDANERARIFDAGVKTGKRQEKEALRHLLSSVTLDAR